MSRVRVMGAMVALIALLATACGDDGGDDGAETGAGTESGGDETSEMVNACPEDGCTISIVDVAAEGDELKVTWEPNFDPDVARNHVHIYWDTYEPGQVSGDAEARGVEQGAWVPTDANPDFVTEGAVSVAEAGDSTTICVTAADGEHTVLDEVLEVCRDVSDLLPA